MGTARRFAIVLCALFAAAASAGAVALWPLVAKNDVAFIEYVQRDVAWGWLLLYLATPLLAACVLTALGAAALALRLATRGANAR